MSKTYLFRADGNAKIGLGHLMRCLTIAQHVQGKVVFVCAEKPSAEVVRDNGYEAYVLHTDAAHMEEELPLWAEVCKGYTQSETTILVDSYGVTKAYLQGLKAYGKVALLDDLGKEAFPVDMICNYNVFAEEEAYRELYANTVSTKFCVGGKFVPIREMFLNRNYRVREEASAVLITTGGGDAESIGGTILKALWERNRTLHYYLVMGKFHPKKAEMEAFAAGKETIHLCENVKDMAHLMLNCDMCVTAGGTTLYELAALGVPFVCFSYAENQEALTAYMGNQKIAGYAGAWHLQKEETMAEMMLQAEELLATYEKRKQYSEQEKQLIDGQGAMRIAKALQEL